MAKRIEVPNVPAEYQYVQALTCDSCGGSTQGQRTGASQEAAKMVDHWTVTCTRCKHTMEFEFAVPKMDLAAMMEMLKNKK
jgi:hypothetical protein